MKWLLYDFKTAKEPWFESACEIYNKKINQFISFTQTTLKTKVVERSQLEEKKKFEEKVLFEKILPEDFVVLLDEQARTFHSMDFSREISKILQSGKRRVIVVIGGAYGVSAAVKDRAQLKISLSQLTMNHLVAEVVFLEQLYRALTIINRIPYHNQ